MNSLIYTLAALLHDIGKFAQRADVSLERSEMLDVQSKNLAGQLCKKSQAGYYTHQHVVWTSWFIDKYKHKFQSTGLLGEGANSLINLAAYHHNPATAEQGLITCADHWSSGIDRNVDRASESNPDHGKDKFRSIPLLSVFPQLRTSERPGGIVENYGYKLQSLNRGETIFPERQTELDLKKDYAALWKRFCEEFEGIVATKPVAFVTSVYALLKKYTWYIPASTMDYPNCSLFEHQKITGAFAHCFAAYRNEYPEAFIEGSNHRMEIADGHYPVLMVCGDISGIQSFIYNISNKSAMKSLKGRSFYVQLLAETLADELAEDCGGTVVNQVYAAGGKFYLLLPNTKEVRTAITVYEREIQKHLFNESGGTLNVYIGMVAFSMVKKGKELKAVAKDTDGELLEIGVLWKQVAEATAARKRKKYEQMLQQDFASFFEPSGDGGDIEVCDVTAQELKRNDVETLQNEDDEDEIRVAPAVATQIEIGKQLYQSRAILKLPAQSRNGYKIGLHSNWYLLNGSEHVHSIQQYTDMGMSEEPELKAGFSLGNEAAVSFRFFGGLPMAKRGDRNRTLEELCLLQADSDQKEKLGVLRMDVDNLGNLFMNGFDPSNASFSSLATLSALLDQFFSGYLNTIRNKGAYKDHVNIVYSGGDDVFAVGRWDLLLEFAYDVREAFKKFVCNRNDISLSAGFTIVGPKFPIAKAAEDAGEAEDAAKNHLYQANDVKTVKNAINIFGISLNWEHEMPFVVACKNDLLRWISEEECMSKGILMKMFSYWELYLKEDISWQWQAAYTLARHARGKTGVAKDCMDIIKNLLFSKNYKNQFTAVRFEAFIVACRWAELMIKQTKTL